MTLSDNEGKQIIRETNQKCFLRDFQMMFVLVDCITEKEVSETPPPTTHSKARQTTELYWTSFSTSRTLDHSETETYNGELNRSWEGMSVSVPHKALVVLFSLKNKWDFV
jgi:hypothetical protein